MCIGKCSRFTGLGLIALALLSVVLNLFLLFPNLDGSYLRNKQISSHAMRMPGVWAGGLMVLLGGVQTTMVGFKVKSVSCCRTCFDMLLSGLFCILALVGAAVSFVFSAAGLLSGPYCLHQVEGEAALEWGYPYISPDLSGLTTSTEISFPEKSSLKLSCIDPPDIETWNSHFYVSLGLVNLLEIVLCLSQLVNAILGVFVGHCDQKKDSPITV
ncbi:transmembrane 4 L6 family member 19 isoform X2 [Hyperolius riggenbachi]|uniref:transmembrane 4 L6 family member 19 isoform X2 n=1 Tax=Hyperolius riggenbachi TaxID=752182 RepID=UPI0035A3873E